MTRLSFDIPVIEAGRLVLREPKLADLTALTAFFDTADSHFVGGPMGANDTQRAYLSTIGSWASFGYGLWHIAERATDRFIGWTGLLLTAGKSEPGFAWTVLPEFQSQGLASEAAKSTLSFLCSKTQHQTPATYIDSANAPSIKLAEKLGFAHEATTGAELTYRYAGGAA